MLAIHQSALQKYHRSIGKLRLKKKCSTVKSEKVSSTRQTVLERASRALAFDASDGNVTVPVS